MTRAKNLITELYLKEDEQDMADDVKTKITVQLDASSVAMLSCIASRFGTSRFALIEPVLKTAVSDMFCELSRPDRDVLAIAADEEAVKIMKKDGKPLFKDLDGNDVSVGSNSWTKAAEYLAKEDSK